MLGFWAELNWNPLGALRISVMLVPVAISPFAPSAITILPSEVYVPPVVSAEMDVPPVGHGYCYGRQRRCRDYKTEDNHQHHGENKIWKNFFHIN